MHGGIWLLAAQKPIAGQVAGKENLLYFRCWQLEGRVADICPKVNSPLRPPPPPTLDKQGVRAFIDRMGGGGGAVGGAYMKKQHSRL